MVEVLERDTVGETIDATVNYVVNNGQKLFTETAGPGGTDVRTGGTVDPRRVPIHNARLHSDPFVLERDGFRFVHHDTKVADFFDEDEVRRVYYPEMEALVKAESGATRVVVFDHTLRTADDELREARKDPRGRAPRAQRLHRMVRRRNGCATCCRTRPTICCNAGLRSCRCGGRSATRSRAGRWRSADARSLAPDDLVVNERRYPDRIGQTYAITYNPGAPLVLVPADAARRGAGLQGLQLAEGRPRPLVRPHRLRRSDLAAERAAARKHRNPHPRLLLVSRRDRSSARGGCRAGAY